MNSALPDIAENPWEIPNPGPKPAPGPERSAWLDLNRLRRFHRELNALLDRIDPALRENRPTNLDQQQIATHILEFIEGVTERNPRAIVARILLRYLNNGFRRYCRQHELKIPKIPLVGDLGLEDGLIDSEVFDGFRLFLKLVERWTEEFRQVSKNWSSVQPKEIGAVFFMSGILFGGLPDRRHWAALLDAKDDDWNEEGGWVWLTYPFFGTNYQYLFDPATEAIWRRVRATRGLSWSEMKEGVTLQAVLKPYKGLLASSRGSTAAVKLVEEAVRASMLRFFPPDILAIALGKVSNTALSNERFRRLIRGPGMSGEDSTQLDVRIRAREQGDARLLIGGAFEHQQLRRISGLVAWDGEKSRADGLKSTNRGSSERQEYVDLVLKGIAAIRLDVARKCSVEGLNAPEHFLTVVCQFVCDLVASGGPVSKKLAPDTIRDYAQSFITHFPANARKPVSKLTADIRQIAYADALQTGKGYARPSLEVAVQLFERTLLDHFGVEDEVDWSAVPLAAPRQSMVDANIVDPLTYICLKETLAFARCSDDAFRRLLQIMAIFLYRFGLRTQDAIELTLADVCLGDDRWVLLRIPESRLTSKKTRNAIREVGPVSIEQTEFELLKSFLHERQRDAGGRSELRHVYLFARTGHGSRLLSESTLLDPLMLLLRRITGDPRIRLYNFRHGFASRHFAAGRSVLEDMDESLQRPLEWQRAHEEDGAWLRAFEMGHISPVSSTTNYVHTGCIVSNYYSRYLIEALLPLEVLSEMAGLSSRSLERTRLRKRGVGDVENQVGNAEMLLQVVRRKWRFSSITSSRRQSQRSKLDLDIRITLGDDWIRPVETGHKRFADVVGIFSDSLVRKLDVTEWEVKGCLVEDVRRWSGNTLCLIEYGLLDASRRRRPSLSTSMVAWGDRVFRATASPTAQGLPRLLARALVGMQHRGTDLRMDLDSGRELVRVMNEHGQDKIRLQEVSEANGLFRVSLTAPDDSTAAGQLRLLTICMAVAILSQEELASGVKPYLAAYRH